MKKTQDQSLAPPGCYDKSVWLIKAWHSDLGSNSAVQKYGHGSAVTSLMSHSDNPRCSRIPD